MSRIEGLPACQTDTKDGLLKRRKKLWKTLEKDHGRPPVRGAVEIHTSGLGRNAGRTGKKNCSLRWPRVVKKAKLLEDIEREKALLRQQTGRDRPKGHGTKGEGHVGV